MTGPGAAAQAVAVFAALGDDTRWGILQRLGRDDLSASALAADLPISRQAVAKHLATLADSGLVEPVRRGREIRYRAVGAPLERIAGELERVAAEWDQRMVRIAAIAERG